MVSSEVNTIDKTIETLWTIYKKTNETLSKYAKTYITKSEMERMGDEINKRLENLGFNKTYNEKYVENLLSTISLQNQSLSSEMMKLLQALDKKDSSNIQLSKDLISTVNKLADNLEKQTNSLNIEQNQEMINSLSKSLKHSVDDIRMLVNKENREGSVMGTQTEILFSKFITMADRLSNLINQQSDISQQKQISESIFGPSLDDKEMIQSIKSFFEEQTKLLRNSSERSEISKTTEQTIIVELDKRFKQNLPLNNEEYRKINFELQNLKSTIEELIMKQQQQSSIFLPKYSGTGGGGDGDDDDNRRENTNDKERKKNIIYVLTFRNKCIFQLGLEVLVIPMMEIMEIMPHYLSLSME